MRIKPILPLCVLALTAPVHAQLDLNLITNLDVSGLRA